MTAESTMGMLPPTEAHSGMTTAATGSVEPQLVPDMKASSAQITNVMTGSSAGLMNGWAIEMTYSGMPMAMRESRTM